MHNFKLIVAIMMSVVIMQLHGSDMRESLDFGIQRCYMSSLKDFITTTGTGKTKKDERYKAAVSLSIALQQQRKNLYSCDSIITSTSEETLKILQVYESSETKVTAVIESQEFKKLKKLCEDMK